MGKIEYKSDLVNYELDSIDELYFLYWLEELNDKKLIHQLESNRIELPINDAVDFKLQIGNTLTLFDNSKSNSNFVSKELIKQKKYTPDFIFKLEHKLTEIMTANENTILCQDKKQRLIELSNIVFYNHNTKTEQQDCNRLAHSIEDFYNYIFIDVKGAYTKQFNSSITFPDRQAMLYNYLGVYVNKIIVFDNKVKSKCLFAKTFTPKKVIDEMIYKRDTGNNKVGDTKIKYKIVTIDEYLTRIGIQ